MPQARRHPSWRCASSIAALLVLAQPAFAATEAGAVKSADHYLATGDLKAAEIELRNAIRQSPQDPVLRARLARVYLKLGDPVSAEREARAARERNGAEADYLPVLVDALLAQGKYADLSDLVKPGNRPPALESEVRAALGVAAAALGDRARAQTLLGDAIRLDPKAAGPKIALARLVAGTNPTEATSLLDQALSVDPRSIEALQVLGEMDRVKGDVKGALSRFDAALKIDPKNVAVRLSRAELNVAEGDYKAADTDLNPILAASPNNFMANYLRGIELAKQKKFADADHIFDRISPVFPRFVNGYYVQGATKLALGQYAAAETALDKYLAHVPTNAKAARLAAIAALRQHAPIRAIADLEPVVAKSPDDAQIRALLGSAYMAAGKSEQALEQFEKAAALEPANAALQTQMAVSEIGAGENQQGIAELEKVFETPSGAAVAGPTLVLTQLRAGRTDKAAAVAAALVQRDAKNPLYQSLLGMVKTAQHDYPAAQTAFRAALSRQPGFAPAVRDLAQLYVAMGRPADAQKLYTDQLAKKPNDETALLGLADIAIAQKDWPQATQYIDRARTAAPNDTAPDLTLVRMDEAQQHWPEAKAVAAALSARFPSDANVLDVLARAQLGTGDTDGAISSYKRAYELVPGSLPILSRYLAQLNSAKYYRQARDVLQQAVDRDPKNTALKIDLVRVTAELDGVDAAVTLAEDYAKADPTSNTYDLVAAQLYENAGRFDAATTLLGKTLAVRPADDPLAVALARLQIRTGHFGQAEATLTHRLSADPKDFAVRTLLGSLYVATGRTDDAKKVYDDLLAQAPNNVAGLLGLADVAIAQKNWAQAVADITRAQQAAPNDPLPGLKLVNLYGMRRDWKNATAAAAQLAGKFSSNINVLDAEGRVQIGAGDLPAAIATYQRAYALAPNSAPILARYIAALSSAKRYPDARMVLQAALQRAPQNTSLKADLIRVEAKIGGVDAGLAKAREFAKADPGTTVYDLVSADLLVDAGKPQEAVALLEKARAAKPSDDGLTTTLARIYARSDPAKAEAFLTARLKTAPSDFAIGGALAALHLQDKNYDAAIAEYSKLLTARPDDAASLNNLAWLYQQKGDLVKARQLAERAVEAAPAAPQIDDTLGWILLAQGDAGKAVTYLTAANVSAPTDPAIQYHLAVALHRVGRSGDAEAMLEKLLASGAAFADKAQAQKLLADLKRG
ncbi:MAG: XrtA/PEP-CTERM system TPR-repeat protein PrsT [Stellaceae bacterium]